MKTINIVKIGDKEYSFGATREDGATVFGTFNEKDIQHLIKTVDSSKNVEEQRLESLNQCISLLLKLESNKKALLDVTEKWQIYTYYPQGHHVVYNDKLFRSLKPNNSSYENIPINAKDIWAEVELDTSEYDKLLKQASYWSADLTYKQGDLVIYYNKLYRSLKNGNVSNPEKSDWELIKR